MTRLLIISTVAYLGACRPSPTKLEAREFAYYFHETTGPTRFIKIDGKEVPFEFETEHSNADRLAAFRALKWSVLYLNTDGQLTIVGIYNPESHELALEHWYLPEKFKAFPGSEAEPGEPEWREQLTSADFKYPTSGDLRIYQRRAAKD